MTRLLWGPNERTHCMMTLCFDHSAIVIYRISKFTPVYFVKDQLLNNTPLYYVGCILNGTSLPAPG